MVGATSVIHEVCNTAVDAALRMATRWRREFGSPPAALQDIVIGAVTRALLLEPAKASPCDATVDRVRACQLAVRYGLGVCGEVEACLRGMACRLADEEISRLSASSKERRRGR